jgi:hypothetical protein
VENHCRNGGRSRFGRTTGEPVGERSVRATVGGILGRITGETVYACWLLNAWMTSMTSAKDTS